MKEDVFMEEEIFKKFEFDNRLYYIGNLGTIKGKEKTLKQRENSDGYLEVTLGSKRRTTFRVHRLVALLFVDNPNPSILTEVNHIDFNRTNARYDNLEWVTHAGNVGHSHSAGHYAHIAQGESNGRAVMSENKVREARKLYENGEYNIKDLAQKYDVSWSTMSHIVKYETWKNVV